MEQTSINLAPESGGIDPKALYALDFSKMEKIEDLIICLAAIGFTFSPLHPYFNQVRNFLALESPIYPNQSTKQKEQAIKLPKLKLPKKDGE
jgi:hypothetical protein